MINYSYDGSFDGLLSLVFDAYNDRKNIGSIKGNQIQIGFLDTYIETDESKARRVEKYIKNNISYEFFNNVKFAFLSSDERKDIAIVMSIYKAMEIGDKVLETMDEYAILMSKIIKKVLSERHRYLGILRFKEVKDGTLFSTIEPKNNVLPILLSHFKSRLINEKFAIFDKKRNMVAYYDTKNFEIFYMEKEELSLSENELEFEELWKIFHKSISIQERENKKLQQKNLPKYYWKNLIEDMI